MIKVRDLCDNCVFFTFFNVNQMQFLVHPVKLFMQMLQSVI